METEEAIGMCWLPLHQIYQSAIVVHYNRNAKGVQVLCFLFPWLLKISVFVTNRVVRKLKGFYILLEITLLNTTYPMHQHR